MGSTDIDTLVSSIETKVKNVPLLTSEPSIYRAPVDLRDVNNKAYTPKLVSIGPYHRNTLALQPMEIHKLRYLKELLSKQPQQNVKFYVENLRELEGRARQCFAESVSLTSNEFLEMVLIDGCFIIEFMLKCCGKESPDRTDFVFSTEWMQMTLAYDMILMENQLPFFVIEHLYNLLIRNQPQYPNNFLSFTLEFLSKCVEVGKFSLTEHSSEHQVKHFVDLVVRCCAPSSLPATDDLVVRCCAPSSLPATELHERPPSRCDQQIQFIPTATELHEAGVKFEKDTSSNTIFLDIKFTKNGVMSIPHLNIHDNTGLIFRNLVAYEQCEKSPRYVSNYTTVMDCLINTPNDVALLRRKGIINSWMSNDEEVSDLFNRMGKGKCTNSSTFYYSKLFEEVNSYYEKSWNILMANLKRNSFNTPWSTISFAAAVILLFCSLVQSYFSVIKP